MAKIAKFELLARPARPVRRSSVPSGAPPSGADESAAPDPFEAALAAASAGIPTLLSAPEVADILGVGVKTLERWRMTGEGPRYVKLTARTVRYGAADVSRFVGERFKSNTAQ